MKDAIYILETIFILMAYDFIIERRFLVKKRILKIFGFIWYTLLLILAVVAIDWVLVSIWTELNNSSLYKILKIGFLVYFIPKKGDGEWSNSKN